MAVNAPWVVGRKDQFFLAADASERLEVGLEGIGQLGLPGLESFRFHA